VEAWVATAPAGEVVAYGVVWCVADEGELANLAVRDDYRGRGLGGRLLDRLMAAAAGRGVRDLFLEVRPSNTAARALYAGRGFAEVGLRPDYYERPREDALVLRATLAPTDEGNVCS